MPVSDETIIAEAIRLVESGASITFPVSGKSMLPFIVGESESLILQKPESIKIGDVVLAFVDNNRYVIHRVVKISGENIEVMGDGNLVQREYCKLNDVKAIATHAVNQSGKKRYLYSTGQKIFSKLWITLQPIRKYLLKIYHLTHKV